MSNLIVTPDEVPSPIGDLVGRVLMLNPEKARRFQCGGFTLSLSRPSAMVTDKAQQEPIQRALLDGRLLDVTNQARTGLKSRTFGHSPVTASDTGKKVFFANDSNGFYGMVTPKDEEEAAKLEQELAEHGHLVSFSFEPPARMSSVEETSIVLNPEAGKSS